ncbi:MAG TPA: Maf family protein [Steroidobacteraceae bacterium]
MSMSAATLILASTSLYRRQLLARLHVAFEVLAPQVDETALPLETPLERAQRLALAKATAVSARRPDATVIGSDQVALCKGELLGKPGGPDICRAQLHWLSASAATFHTAVTVLQASGAAIHFVDTTTVYFRALSGAEIERYVAADRPFDCAGGFRGEGLGISLFARIVSDDPSALIGLPLIAVGRALRQLGYPVP